MATIAFKSVDEYIASKPEAVRGVLQTVRRVIQNTLPGTDECITYNIPTYKRQGRPVVYFAGWKHHYSVYPVSDALVAQLNEYSVEYEVEKGTIRFPFSAPVPDGLIGKIAELRAKEVAGSAKK